jgi:hypothetical protein
VHVAAGTVPRQCVRFGLEIRAACRGCCLIWTINARCTSSYRRSLLTTNCGRSYKWHFNTWPQKRIQINRWPRWLLCVCVCVWERQLWCCFQPHELRTYEATALSIRQATAQERGQRFLLATLGDTASWGIRQCYEIFFRISWILISVHPTTIGYSQLLTSLFSLDSLLKSRLLSASHAQTIGFKELCEPHNWHAWTHLWPSCNTPSKSPPRPRHANRGDGKRNAPAALPTEKTRFELYRGPGGPWGKYGRARKISHPPGFEPRNDQPVASHIFA